MRFVVFGGAGDMGRRAVEELARTPGVARVTVADRNLEAARAVAQQVAPVAAPGCQVVAEAVDVLQPGAAAALMAEHDVAVGAAGPFYLLEEPLVRAAIDARRPYVSLCDDHDAARRVLDLDEPARAAGVTILTGLGWTPGLTNLCVRHAAGRMERVEAAHIAWAGSSADSRGWAVVLHTMHIFSGQVTSFAGGRWEQVAAGSGAERVVFPRPLGPVTVFHVGHPEPVTLPRFIPELQEVRLKGGLAEPVLNRLAVGFGRWGLMATHRRRQRLGAILKPLLPLLERVGAPARPASGLVVRVRGRQDGQPVERVYRAVAPMASLTAVPVALGALWMAQGRIQGPGVLAPEAPGGPEPEAFFQELERRGVRVERAP
ncbi:Saccharopine dehydrogenase [Thermaerobacter marianensis DSM 12885]|uniref:Saccharopine dehydrogenase n=1 Tax=Thermaerobacter marianensis (strain ATCC 700841 / DSM 12885 / JCM 10246 / 7p75a) TaxID=644966 RepID=E6SJY7_THEM7|nr:saccharopine dehydrogenase NADP-binding domain-containing protein [Thermaerobacter marianensis]ADU52220.1 Saccharopine dehydrogenase [Thermaerobacter marianensis DSM 12885]